MKIKDSISPQRELGAYEALWSNGVSSFKQVRDYLREANATSLAELVDPAKVDEFYEQAVAILRKSGVESFGVRVDGTVDYPEKLRDADYPLALVYFQGWWDLALTPGVAVVGTRKPTAEGVARAERLVKWLVSRDLTIFSGLAAGIDRVAHTSAIKYGGRTVAVIGTPLSMAYPKENAELQQTIAREHLVVSQVPVCRYYRNGPKFNRFYFPERNKTMSALSTATVIVEAGETSGTLVQAQAALKQGRKLFILNSCFEDATLTWPKKFEEKGATRVRDFEDIERVLFSS